MANELVTDDVVDDEAVADDTIGDAQLRESAALTVIGRSANSTGNPADIAAVAASGAVLREASNVLGFGTIASAGIATAAVTRAKLSDGTALSLIGRSANSSGVPADIAAVAASGAVMRESGSAIAFGTVATAGIADAAVTSAKLRDSAAVSVIGRSANSSGVPADIAAAADSTYFGRRSSALGFFALIEDDLGGVISRQTLSGDTPDITIAVADTDERVEIDFYGPTTAGDITLQVNGGGTPVTNGGTIQTSGGAVSGSTARMIANYTGPLSFRLVLDIKNLGLHRTGYCWAVSKNTGSTARDLDITAVVWPDASNNVTSLVLHSSVATGFKSGSTVIARRRKIT